MVKYLRIFHPRIGVFHLDKKTAVGNIPALLSPRYYPRAIIPALSFRKETAGVTFNRLTPSLASQEAEGVLFIYHYRAGHLTFLYPSRRQELCKEIPNQWTIYGYSVQENPPNHRENAEHQGR